MNVQDTLDERGRRYGSFADNADTSQMLKDTLRLQIESNEQYEFSEVHYEGIEMICHKLARIVNGDPDYIDNWVDIAGYATLVAEHIKRSENAS